MEIKRHKLFYPEMRSEQFFVRSYLKYLEAKKSQIVSYIPDKEIGNKLLPVYLLGGLKSYYQIPLYKIDREKEKEGIAMILKLSCSFFNKAYHPKQKVKVQFDDEVIEHEGIETTDYMGYTVWLQYMHLYITCRCDTGINLLKNTTRERLLNSAQMHTSEADFAFIEFIQSIFLPEVKSSEAFQKAWQACMNAKEEYTGQDLGEILMIYAPTLLVYQALFSGNSEAFNEQLFEALELHKEFYDTEREGAFFDYPEEDGAVSWPLLAVCSIAYDSGLKVNVESDYIPKWLYEGEVRDWGLKF